MVKRYRAQSIYFFNVQQSLSYISPMNYNQKYALTSAVHRHVQLHKCSNNCTSSYSLQCACNCNVSHEKDFQHGFVHSCLWLLKPRDYVCIIHYVQLNNCTWSISEGDQKVTITLTLQGANCAQGTIDWYALVCNELSAIPMFCMKQTSSLASSIPLAKRL